MLGLAQLTVSKHLKILEEVGLVNFRKNGSWIIYRLTTGDDSEYAAVMLEHLQEWLESDPEILTMIDKASQFSRERSCAA